MDGFPCLIGMNLGASAADKMWPAPHFAALADKLADRFDSGVSSFYAGPEKRTSSGKPGPP